MFLVLLLSAGFCSCLYICEDKGNISEINLPKSFEIEMADDAFENAGEIRIMSSNLLVDYKSWGGLPAKAESKKYIALLDAYKPDVIGVQEFCENWFCAVNYNLPDGYKNY